MARKKQEKTQIRKTVDTSKSKIYLRQQIADNIQRSRLRRSNAQSKAVTDYIKRLFGG